MFQNIFFIKMTCKYKFYSYPIHVLLVEKYKEYDVISEASDSVHGWHFDDKCENVVDECVERFVGHHPPRQMGHRLQLIVDK